MEIESYTNADSRGEWFILAEGTVDEAQASGRWLKTTDPVVAKQ